MLTRTKRVGVAGILMLAAVAQGACGDGAHETPLDASIADVVPLPDAPPPDAPPPDAPPPDAAPPDAAFVPGEPLHFVGNTLKVPTTAAETAALGLDIDGDENHRPDNALGSILAALRQQNVDVQAAVDASVHAGKLVLLHSLLTTDLINSSNASWRVHVGLPTAAPPLFDGSDAFTIDPAAPADDLITGRIIDGRFEGGPGTATVLLTMGLGAPPVPLHLVAAHLRAKVTADGCSDGILGGAVTVAESDAQLVPGFATMFNASIDDDGPDGLHPVACTAAGDPCPNAQNGDSTSCDTARGKCFSATSKTLLNLFDVDHDSVITTTEVANNTLIRALLAPDLDLFDATGQLNPNSDHVADSLSLGVGFTCVPATFTVPGK
jgi:hypothetical protein